MRSLTFVKFSTGDIILALKHKNLLNFICVRINKSKNGDWVVHKIANKSSDCVWHKYTAEWIIKTFKNDDDNQSSGYFYICG